MGHFLQDGLYGESYESQDAWPNSMAIISQVWKMEMPVNLSRSCELSVEQILISFSFFFRKNVYFPPV